MAPIRRKSSSVGSSSTKEPSIADPEVLGSSNRLNVTPKLNDELMRAYQEVITSANHSIHDDMVTTSEIDKMYVEVDGEICNWASPRHVALLEQQPVDFYVSSEKHKRKFSAITDAVPIRTAPQSTVQQEDGDMMMWSGPRKPPRSPIECNETLLVSDPVYRLPRQSAQSNVAKKSRSTSNAVHRKPISKGGGEVDNIMQQGAIPCSPNEKSNSAPCEVQTSESCKMLPQKKRIAHCNAEAMLQGNRKSTHMPPRDPLCHVAIVTPPCPIKTAEAETPTELQTYTHAPELPADLIPFISQEFNTFQELYDFYNTYAKHTGFGIKIGQRSKKTRYLRCVREGKYKPSVAEPDRQRDKLTKRTGCKASIRFKQRDDGTCVVKGIIHDHNHKLLLSPSMMVFLHSHKKVDSNLKDYVKDLQASNVKHVNIMGLLSKLHNGRGNLPFHDKDILNLKAAFAREESKGAVPKMFKLFKDMENQNENFFYDVQVDEEDTIKNIFWSNASCRAAYADFGDCITFDTTYKTNRRHMPLAVFVGVNNHLQSCIFGVALMGDESDDSFKWVFSTFLRCMRGKQPMVILTDQCPAMAKAIPQIFTRCLHKLCRWHIMRKHKVPLAELYKLYPELKEQLAAVLNHPLMPAEFENAWHALVQKYGLQDVNVMINLWAERETWVSAYWKGVFCARMTSTQRSESMNHVLKKGYVKEQQDLHIFIQQVNNCIQTLHESENAEKLASMGVRKPTTRYGFEAQLIEEYTRNVYNAFAERLYHSTAFRIKTSQENPTNYLVHHYNQSREFAWSRHEFRVLADEHEGEFECECKLWEHTGLFCQHVLAVFEHIRLDKIPVKYILKRYTKDPVTEPEFNRKDYARQEDSSTTLQYRRTVLYSEAMKTVNKGCSSDRMFDKALSAFKEVNSRLDHEAMDISNVTPHEDTGPTSAVFGEIPENQDEAIAATYAHIKAPEKVKTKGSKSTNAVAKTQGKKEKPAPSQPDPELDENGVPLGKRLCSSCNKIAGHNSRTCKKRQLAAKLLETHQKVHGPTKSTENVELCIKKLLAQKSFRKNDDEESLDTDEDEDYEDETGEEDMKAQEEEEEEGEEEEEEEEGNVGNDANQNGDDVQEENTEETNTNHAQQHNELNTNEDVTIQTGKRLCSICKERKGHYASTCPRRLEILQERLLARQVTGDTKMSPQGKRVCGSCGKIRGHNARTCARLMLEEEIRQQQLNLQSQQSTDTNKATQKSSAKDSRHDTTSTGQTRRSSRLSKK